MKAQHPRFQAKAVAAGMTVLIGLGVGTEIYAKGHHRNGGAEQETEASRALRLKLAEERKMMPHFEASREGKPSKRDRREIERFRGRA